MKRLLALMLTLALCFVMCACSCAGTSTDPTKPEPVACNETTIRTLMEQNLDCYFIFYVEPLSHTTQQNSDGYYGAEKTYFADYNGLKNLVESTYIPQKASMLLNYPEKETPLYKNVEGNIFMKPDVAEFTDYKIIWDETYTVKITSNTESECKFTLNTTDFDQKPYTVNGTAVYQNNRWLLTDIIY